MGPLYKHEWGEVVLEASWQIRNNPEIIEADFIDRVTLALDRQGKKAPEKSGLQEIFKQVSTFEKSRKKQRR